MVYDKGLFPISDFPIQMMACSRTNGNNGVTIRFRAHGLKSTKERGQSEIVLDWLP